MQTFRDKFTASCISFINTHLFLTLISLPIMLAWGLPISWLSPIGNLIFSPVLTLFLLISSLIFFAELLTMPNGLLIQLLEWITYWWKQVVGYDVSGCMIAFKQPHWFVIIAIPILTCAVLFHPYLQLPKRRLYSLSLLFIATCTLLSVNPSEQKPFTILNQQSALECMHKNDKIVLIDKGAIGRKMGSYSFVSYTLVPELIKKTGSMTIDYLILTKPGIFLFEGLATLLEKMTIKTIYMPYLDGAMDPKLKRIFNRFYAIAKSKNVQMVACSGLRERMIEKINLTIKSEGKTVYRTIEYWPLTAEGTN